MDRCRVGGWKGRGLFFTWPCVDGASLPPHYSLSLFPRRAVTVTGLAAPASLGHSGIPPCHALPAPLPPAVSCPLNGSIFTDSWFDFIFCLSNYRDSWSCSQHPRFFCFCFIKSSFLVDWRSIAENSNTKTTHARKLLLESWVRIILLYINHVIIYLSWISHKTTLSIQNRLKNREESIFYTLNIRDFIYKHGIRTKCGLKVVYITFHAKTVIY